MGRVIFSNRTLNGPNTLASASLFSIEKANTIYRQSALVSSLRYKSPHGKVMPVLYY